MSRQRDLGRRFLRGAAAFLIAGSIAAPGLAAAQQEAPTAETEITVNIAAAEGSLNVSWASGAITFLTDDGSNPTLDASNASVHVSASFAFTIADTRSAPTGYTIVLSTDGLVADSGATILAESLMVSAVSGVPDAATATVAPGTTLAAPVAIMTIPDGAAAVNATVDLVIGTTLPATATTGTYSGGFTLTMQPIDSQP